MSSVESARLSAVHSGVQVSIQSHLSRGYALSSTAPPPRLRSHADAARRQVAALSAMRSTADEARHSLSQTQRARGNSSISTQASLEPNAATEWTGASSASGDIGETEEENEEEVESEEAEEVEEGFFSAPPIRTTIAERSSDEPLGRGSNSEPPSQRNSFSEDFLYARFSQSPAPGRSADTDDGPIGADESSSASGRETSEEREFRPVWTTLWEAAGGALREGDLVTPAFHTDSTTAVRGTSQAARSEGQAPVISSIWPVAQTEQRLDASDYLWTGSEDGGRNLSVPVAGAAEGLRLSWTEITPVFSPEDFARAADSGGQEASEAICIVCMERPVNATFIHGHTGHTACCLGCALALQVRGETCPVCRREFSSVIRNYMA